jgi:hypothetical protein
MSRRGRLYRQFFTAQECARLDSTDPDSPVHEINLLRILITRLLAAAGRGRQTFERLADMLAAFCHAGRTMASLARIYYKQHGPPPDPLLAELAAIDSEPL